MSRLSCPSREQLSGFVSGLGDLCEWIAEHLEHCPACDAAVRELEAMPDPVIEKLRLAAPEDPYAAESECRRAMAVVAALGRQPSFTERSADAGVQANSAGVGYARPDDDRWDVELVPVGHVVVGNATPADDLWGMRSCPDPDFASAGRFRILRRHAEGALGQVSVAMDEELHREVALKEIKEGFADNPESRARFLLEAEITGGLEHPGIVPVYSLGTHADGGPFYAMRFIRGHSLKDAIAQFHQGTGTPRRAPDFASLDFRHLLGRFNAVCNAIAYAHSRGVLHRDLKPANIMLGNYGETLVVDWGLAKAGITGQEAGVRDQHAACGFAPSAL